jgi:hypothetical protein
MRRDLDTSIKNCEYLGSTLLRIFHKISTAANTHVHLYERRPEMVKITISELHAADSELLSAAPVEDLSLDELRSTKGGGFGFGFPGGFGGFGGFPFGGFGGGFGFPFGGFGFGFGKGKFKF